jgi:hypothetical protein
MSEEKTIEDYLEKHGGYAHPMPLKTIQQIAEDLVNHPPHYTAHPSGVECIQITEHMNFCLGNAIKYIWRADLKHDAIEDLKKAVWYVNREIERRTKALQATTSTKTSSRKS